MAGRCRGHAGRLLSYRVLVGMSECHQIVRPLFDKESLPPARTLDLLMPTYCHVPFYYLSAQTRLSISRRQGKLRGESKCPKNHALIVQMIGEGRTRDEIATKVGTTTTAVYKYTKKHGLAEPGKPYMAIARERLEEIQDLWKQGITQREIAKRLGINRWSVCEILSGRVKRNR